jgi:hypothetical protein
MWTGMLESSAVYWFPSHYLLPQPLNYIKCIFLLQIDRIIFCLFLKDDVKMYEKLMQVYFPAGDIHNNLWSAEAGMTFLVMLTIS